ncbi:hypothetical protein [Marinicella sp. W31]|uniref:hypothetical protein n=1 Tax=Marinicella sp. W31 TaxID=3023713 RepID=UPI003756DB3F
MDEIQKQRHYFEVCYWIKEGYINPAKQDELKKRLLTHRKPEMVDKLITDINIQLRKSRS